MLEPPMPGLLSIGHRTIAPTGLVAGDLRSCLVGGWRDDAIDARPLCSGEEWPTSVNQRDPLATTRRRPRATSSSASLTGVRPEARRHIVLAHAHPLISLGLPLTIRHPGNQMLLPMGAANSSGHLFVNGLGLPPPRCLTCPPTRCANSLVEDILNGLDSDLPDEARAYVKKMCVYTCKGERTAGFWCRFLLRVAAPCHPQREAGCRKSTSHLPNCGASC